MSPLLSKFFCYPRSNRDTRIRLVDRVHFARVASSGGPPSAAGGRSAPAALCTSHDLVNLLFWLGSPALAQHFRHPPGPIFGLGPPEVPWPATRCAPNAPGTAILTLSFAQPETVSRCGARCRTDTLLRQRVKTASRTSKSLGLNYSDLRTRFGAKVCYSTRTYACNNRALFRPLRRANRAMHRSFRFFPPL